MMLDYITQTLIFQLVFLLAFEIFLKKETYYTYNRLYLLITPVIALILPFLKLEFLAETVSSANSIRLPEVFIGEGSGKSNLPAENGFNPSWWIMAYFAGALVSSIIFLRKFSELKELFRFRKISEEKEFRIIEVPNSKIACTFFSTIFLGDQLSEKDKEQILSHELVHVRQKHSFDILFFEVLKIIFWFNPLIYIYQSRITGLHEFIADEEVVKKTNKKIYYEQLLNSAFSTQNISFTNQFFKHSLIKKRILMLQKNKSSQLAKFKFLLVIPAMLVMLTYVACSEERDQNMVEEEMSLTDKIADLEASLEAKEELTDEEKEQFSRLILKKRELLNVRQVDNSEYDGKNEVPFAVIDKAPAFEGCDKWVDDPRRNCTSNEISKFVSANFNTDLGKQLGLTGVNRVIVQFRIDQNGKVQDIKTRAPHPELEEEAKRVIASLPDFIPGEQNGKPVSVMYSLPIAFQVSE